MAEGAPAESFADDDSRPVFGNAAEYHALYPQPNNAPATFCAPRVEAGEQLEAVRAAIAARAGLAGSQMAQGGPLRGYLERASRGEITGWARQPDHPHAPARLEVLAGDTVLGTVLANERRPDVHAAGEGDGRCGFTLTLPVPLSPFADHVIHVRRAADLAELGNSGLRLGAECAGGSPAMASDQRPLALFIDETPPGRDAGSRAALDHMRALQALGYRVAFAAHHVAAGSLAGAELAALGVASCLPPAMASVEEMLRRLGAETVLVYLHRIATVSLYGGLVRAHCPRARVVYSVADLHYVRLAREAALERRGDLEAASRSVRAREVLAARSVDAVITHSAFEADLLRIEAPSASIHVVPWSVTPRPRKVGFDERSGLAFLGGFRHRPNVDAARWLLAAVMPLVWRHDPGIACVLVGGDVPDDLRRAADPRVTVLGEVAALDEVFDRVRLTVAPLRFGAGLKGKVIDSLAAGLPCAMTPIAAEGIGLPPLLHGCVGCSAEDLAAIIVRLHNQEAWNTVCTQAALRFVQDRLSPARIDRLLASALGIGAVGGEQRSQRAA